MSLRTLTAAWQQLLVDLDADLEVPDAEKVLFLSTAIKPDVRDILKEGYAERIMRAETSDADVDTVIADVITRAGKTPDERNEEEAVEIDVGER